MIASARWRGTHWFICAQATNGGTHFVPWGEDGRSGDAIISPDLPAGSVIMYDSVGLLHRAGDHTVQLLRLHLCVWVGLG